MNNQQVQRILVVDSDANTIATLEQIIKEFLPAVEIVYAKSVEQAFRKIIQFADISQARPFELIVADVFLEGIGTGLDLWTVVEGAYPEMPFLIVSTLSYQQVLKSIDPAKRSNLVYLMKPFSKEAFLQTLSTVPHSIFSKVREALPQSLINSKDVHQQMTNMIILKLSIDWLEKQQWIDEPYGGQNPAQDLIFKARLTSKRLSDAFFSSSGELKELDKETVADNILQLIELTPELKTFYTLHKLPP